MCVGETLNMDSCSKFWGNLEGIWGNPGEIPHIGWKIPRVYRVNVTCASELTFTILARWLFQIFDRFMETLGKWEQRG